MHVYSNICNNEVKTDFKKHRVCGELVQTLIINIPKISDINILFYDYIISQNKKYEFYTKEVIFNHENETREFYFDNTKTINMNSIKNISIFLRFLKRLLKQFPI